MTFLSHAVNLVAGDTNNALDVFVRDLHLGTTTRISVDSNGNQANGRSESASISADGRYVAFISWASDLVGGDTNGTSDVFVRDLQLGTTTRVSVDSNGNQANGSSEIPLISGDGRYVAFSNHGSNLVAGDTNGQPDVFVRDRQLGTTTRVSVDSAGNQGNHFSYSQSISTNGRYVAFFSFASNLVSGDTNKSEDVFVHDLLSHTTARISVNSAGSQGNDHSHRASFGGNGRYVAFISHANNLVEGDTNDAWDVFVRDVFLGITVAASVRNGSPGTAGGDGDSGTHSNQPVSADGRYVAFYSYASNLVADDTNGFLDVFVRDLQLGTTTRVSVGSAGGQGHERSFDSSISGDGRYVAFSSYASNLVAGDTNATNDVFVRDLLLGTTTRVSVDNAGGQGNAGSSNPSSSDGRFVAFESGANTGTVSFSGLFDFSNGDTAAGFKFSYDFDNDGVFEIAGSSSAVAVVPAGYLADGPDSRTVKGRIEDKDGGYTEYTTTLAINNVAPGASISGPADGVPGQPRTFTFSSLDPSPIDQAAGFVYLINWGDGTPIQTINRTAGNGSGVAVDHVYTTTGIYTVQVTATDKDAGTSAAVSHGLTIEMVQTQGDTLAVGGTLAGDVITLGPGKAAGALNVSINTGNTKLVDGDFLMPTGRIFVFGQAGNDTITLEGKKPLLTVPAFLYGGDGKDTIKAAGSTANNVLFGDAGDDNLFGGKGRDLLIGGAGADKIDVTEADKADRPADLGSILIGGTTDYDLASALLTFDQQLAALNGIMAEWGRTDAVCDTLWGSPTAPDWFFALLSGPNQDEIKNKTVDEIVAGL